MAYGAALKVDPSMTFVFSNLAIVDLSRSRWFASHGGDPEAAWASAREAAREALSHLPDDAFAHFNLGESYREEALYRLQRLEDPTSAVVEARRWYSSGLKLRPRMIPAWVDLGRLSRIEAEHLSRIGLNPSRPYREALESLGRALELDSDKASAMVERGLVRSRYFQVPGWGGGSSAG